MTKLRMLAAGAILAIAPRAAVADTPPNSTPLAMVGSWAVVTVHFGDDPRDYRFIVDSAAGATVLDSALAEKALEPGSEKGESEVQGASGAGTSFRHGVVANLAVAGRQIDNLEVLVTDMSRFGAKTGDHYDGILGHDVLNRYSYVFDVPGGQLALIDADRPDATRWSRCTPNLLHDRDDSQSGFIAARVGLPTGGEATAVIDTGAAKTILNWPAGTAAGLRKDGPGVTADKAVVGFDPKAATAAYQTMIAGAKLADVALAPFAARLSDLPVFEGFGLAAKPAMILGINVLGAVPFAVSRGAREFCTAA